MRAKGASDIFGIDVSQHQGVVNWAKVGVKFVYIKATEGKTYTDPKFTVNAEGANSAGIAVGYYHYAHPENNSAVDEATSFYKAVYGHSYKLPLVLDVEGEASKLGKDKLTAWCKTFLEELKKLTKSDVMIYTGASFAKTFLGAELGAYPLWIANYGVNTPMANGTWKDWSAFQYNSSGKVDGISGNVDVNVMDPSFFAKYTKPKVETPELPDLSGATAVNVEVNGKKVGVGVLANGVTYIPARLVVTPLGAQITYDSASKTVKIVD